MSQQKKRKRRIRKKLFLDEFAVFVFELRIDLKATTAEEELAFLDSLIDKLESMQLSYVGHFLDEKLRGYILAKGRYASPTEDQRQELIRWCESRTDIKKLEIGELVDGNWGLD